MSGELVNRSLVRRLAAAFGPQMWVERRALTFSYVWRLIAIIAALFAPWPLKIIIDNVITARPLPNWQARIGLGVTPEQLVLLMTVLFLLTTTIGALANAWEKNISAGIRERLTWRVRDRLLGHLQTLSPTFRNDNRSGELVLRLVNDSDLFVRVLTKTVPLVFQHFATLALTLFLLFWINVRLGLLAGLLVPLLALVGRYYSRRLWAASRKKRKHEGKVSGLAQEIVRGLPVIQALGSEDHARKRFGKSNVKRLKAGVEETRVAVEMERTLQIIQGLALALATGGGALLVLRAQITIGELTLFAAYMGQLLKPIEKLNDLAETAGRGLAGGERLLALLAMPPFTRDKPDATELTRVRGQLEFRDVWFTYAETESPQRPVLRGVNLRLEPGRLAVLIGESGAGKSTLLSLIVRLFDPTSGEILLDGVSLTELKTKSLREQIAIMTQEMHLFSGTLRRSLSPHGLRLRDARLWEALALVHLDEFVGSLPLRLDTPLGEDGLNLSGGQRQRLSLARAFLLDRPILLLDEPLANVDAVSASVILNALDQLRADKTCLAITHESSLLNYADDIYHLEDGRIRRDEERSPVPKLRRMACCQRQFK